MEFEYPNEKTLEKGVTLRLKTWVSDFICPGRRMYQLELVTDSPRCTTTCQFPTNFEDYNARHVRRMYDTVNSVEDFHRLEGCLPNKPR